MGLKILVVDDEPDLEALMLQRFRKQIRREGYEFTFARNGVEALESLDADEEIELVLTDINMPEMDGLTLLSKLRELGRPIKAVVISAYGDMDNIRTAMNRGAFDFLTKPIDLQDLDITLEKSCAEIRLTNEAMRNRDSLVAIERELSIASEIQQSMLPQSFPLFPDRTDIDIHARMMPAKALGGDFYDFFLVDEDRIGFVVGDVSGKGVPAALLMSLTRSLVKSIARTGLAPDECVARVNGILAEENTSHRFVTLFYGVLEAGVGTVTYCNAGHNPPYVLRNGGSVAELDRVGGMVIGIREDAEFDSGQVTLAPGDSIFLYTDGVTEAMNVESRVYGDDRLFSLLGRAFENANDVVRTVLDDVEAHIDGAPQSDDITAAALRYPL